MSSRLRSRKVSAVRLLRRWLGDLVMMPVALAAILAYSAALVIDFARGKR